MTNYTTPQRTNRKRSLFRRAKILLPASLLIPVSLFAITIAPASAAPSNNPIFATLQDVQDAINAALTPIQNAVASLQQQQNNQQTAITNLQNTQATHTSQISDLQTQQQSLTQQISSLQNSTGKSLRAYDANGQELGLLVNADSVIYIPSLQRFISINSKAFPSNDQAFTHGELFYQSSDCSGTPYVNNQSFNVSYIYTPDGSNFYDIPDSTATTQITYNSTRLNNSCSRNYNGVSYGLPQTSDLDTSHYNCDSSNSLFHIVVHLITS